MREPASDEHVAPVKSKELDQLVELAQAAACGDDECRLDPLGVLAAERLLRQVTEAADDLSCVVRCEVTVGPVDQPLGWLCHESIVPNGATWR